MGALSMRNAQKACPALFSVRKKVRYCCIRSWWELTEMEQISNHCEMLRWFHASGNTYFVDLKLIYPIWYLHLATILAAERRSHILALALETSP